MTTFQFTNPGFRNLGNFVNDILNEVPNYSNSFYPRTNINETKDSFIIEMLVPGRAKEDFKISLDKNLLTVSYENKKDETKDETKKVIKKEFSLRSFSRTFTVDEMINFEGIEAKYENGILTLVLPKKEEIKEVAKEIKVQ